MATDNTLFDMLGTDENKKRAASRARSIDNLSSLGGLAAQPQSPMAAGTAGLGITPDQAKMAGSSAQLAAAPVVAPPKGPSASATEQGAAAEQQKSEEAIRKQGESAASMQDQQLKDLAASWGDKVGSFNLRTATNMGGAITDQMGQAVAGQGVDNAQMLATMSPEQRDSVTAASAALNAAGTPADRNKAINDLELALGAEGGLSSADVSNFLSSANPAAYAEYMANKAPDTVTVDALNAHAAKDGSVAPLDTADIATKLGLDPAAVGAMSLTQIKKAIDDKLTASFGQVDGLKFTLNNSALSATDRADARQQLIDAGETGIAATDAEIKDLQKVVATTGDIKLADGSNINVESLLADDNFKALMTGVLSGDKDAIAELNTIPELKEFYDTNKALVDASYTRIATESKDWNVLEKTQTDLATSLVGVPNVLKQVRESLGLSGDGLIYDPDKLKQVQANPVVGMLMDPSLPKGERDQRTADIKGAMEAGLSVGDLGSYTQDQLKAFGFGDPAQATTFSAAVKTIATLKDPNASPDAVLDSLFPTVTKSFADATKNLTANTGTAALLGSTAPGLMALDTNHDGVLSADEFKNGLVSPENLAAILKKGSGDLTAVNPLSNIPGFSSPGDFKDSIGAGLAKVVEDGHVTDSELSDILTPAALQDVGGLTAIASGNPPGLKGKMTTLITAKEKSAVDGLATQYTTKLDAARTWVDETNKSMSTVEGGTTQANMQAYNEAVGALRNLQQEYAASLKGVLDTYTKANTTLGIAPPSETASLMDVLSKPYQATTKRDSSNKASDNYFKDMGTHVANVYKDTGKDISKSSLNPGTWH